MIKKIFSIVLLIFLVWVGISSDTYGEEPSSYVNYDLLQYGGNPESTHFKGVNQDEDDQPYVYDPNLTLTSQKILKILKGTPITLHNIDGTTTSQSITDSQFSFENLSQVPVVANNVIYLGFGYRNSNNTRSYGGMIAVKVNKVKGEYEYNLHLSNNTLHAFETERAYFGANGSSGGAVNRPAINESKTILFYPISQWAITYDLNSYGKMQYKESIQIKHSDITSDSWYNIGGAATIDGSYAFYTSWTGRIYKMDINNLSNYKGLNMSALTLTSSDSFANRVIMSSEPTVATYNNQKRILWGTTPQDPNGRHTGGVFCSAKLDFTDLKCTIGSNYYNFNPNTSVKDINSIPYTSVTAVKSRSGNPARIDASVDSSAAWSNTYNLAFLQDRWGNYYSFDFYGRMVMKETSMKGSSVFGGVGLGMDTNGNMDRFGYVKVNNSRPGDISQVNAFVNSQLNPENSCYSGRIVRYDNDNVGKYYSTNQFQSSGYLVLEPIPFTGNASQNIISILSEDNATLNDGIFFSHKDWAASSSLAGYPTIVGNTLLATSSGCGGAASTLFITNIKPPTTNQAGINIARENININNPGRMEFLVDKEDTYFNIGGIANFSGPIGGLKIHDDLLQASMVLAYNGLIVIYKQNSDFFITDLSVKPDPITNKFYQIDAQNPDATYKGRIRAISSTVRKVKIPEGININDANIVVKVFHTLSNVSGDDNYKCDTPNGNKSCYYSNNEKVNESYLKQEFFNENSNPTSSDYGGGKYYRTLLTEKIPLKSLNLTEKIDEIDGSKYYSIPFGEVLIDKEFDVFLNNFKTTPVAQKHRLIAVIDFENLIDEEIESNNVGTRIINYEGNPRPDLELVCVPNTPSNGVYATNVNYDGIMKIKNTSKESTAKFGFNYIINRNDLQFSVGNVLTTAYPNGTTLQPGQSIDVPFTFSIPLAQDYRFNISINTQKDSGQLPETNYANNDCEFNVFPESSDNKPDLVATSVGTTDSNFKFKFDDYGSLLEGYDIPVRGIILNDGKKAVDIDNDSYLRVRQNGTTKVEVYQNCKAILQSKKTCYIGAILPKSIIKEGSYDIYMKADNSNVVPEISETNNILTNTFYVSKVDALAVPNGTFSPNGGGIRDTIAMSLSDFYISNYTTSYRIAIFDKYNNVVKTLASESIGFRYPHVGSNPHDVPDISAYQSNYLNQYNAISSWNSIPKTNGYYMWDGKNDAGIVQPDDNYRIGIRYVYESSNPIHNDWLVPNGCSECTGWTSYTHDEYTPPLTHDHCDGYRYWDCYQHIYPYPNCYIASSSFPTSYNFGSEVIISNPLEINNAEILPQPSQDGTVKGSIKSSEHIYISDSLSTRMEASSVTVSFPAELIETNKLNNTSWVKNGNKIIITLIPVWSTNYNESETYRCNSDPYCNKWKLADNDAIVINKLAPDGEYDVVFTAITAWDTPNSPVSKTVKLRIQDAIYNYIKVQENWKK